MTDLILPIVVGGIAVLIALGAQRAWERHREGFGRPNLRTARLLSHWAEKVRAVRMTHSQPSAAPAKTEPAATRAVPLPVATLVARAGDEQPHGPVVPPARPTIGLVGQTLPGSVTYEATVVTVMERARLDKRASADRVSPKPAKRPRGHSTIAVDPLDAPLDPRHARVAAGGLIHDLEVGTIEHPR